MKFWTRLRWITTAAFVALLLWSWWAAEPSQPTDTPRALRF